MPCFLPEERTVVICETHLTYSPSLKDFLQKSDWWFGKLLLWKQHSFDDHTSPLLGRCKGGDKKVPQKHTEPVRGRCTQCKCWHHVKGPCKVLGDVITRAGKQPYRTCWTSGTHLRASVWTQTVTSRLRNSYPGLQRFFIRKEKQSPIQYSQWCFTLGHTLTRATSVSVPSLIFLQEHL